MNLTIPENIPLEWELVRGLGRRELIQCLCFLLPALVIELVLSMLLTAPIVPLALIMVYIFLIFLSYLFFAKLDRQSMYTFLRWSIRFRREQQAYYYKRRKEVLCHYEETTR